MHDKKQIGIVGNGASPYALISALMMASSRQLPKITEEEKIKRAERRRLSSEERIRQAKVIKNICPACEGKLIRGKKDKRNDYKHLWTCKDCGSSHTT